MTYTVLIAVPFNNWSRKDEAYIKNELTNYDIEGIIVSEDSKSRQNILEKINRSNLILVLYSSAAFSLDFINQIIESATSIKKKTIVIKERGTPLRGRVMNVDIIEYDNNKPEQALSMLIQNARDAKADRDTTIGMVAAGAVGLGLAAGAAYLMYKLLKKDDEN